MKKISLTSRILLAVGALALLAMLKLPIWEIYLMAPQYPEGLEMKIWHNNITGDVRVISALNHYIGMRAISVEMFPEFKILGTIIMVVAALCFVLALVGRMWSAIAYYLVLAVADSAAMYDFWKWGYDYGHNLDPNAAIVIPGMAYQPPLIGYKKLLNFEAWSVPDWGGWILMFVTAMAFFIVVAEWWLARRRRKAAAAGRTVPVASIALLMGWGLLLNACSSGGPQPIRWGEDNCDHCKMTLVDRQYGAEIVTKKGKAYKFDDLNCLVGFMKKNTVPADQIAEKYVINLAQPGAFVPAEAAVYLFHEELKTPMAAGVAAFGSLTELEQLKKGIGGEVWDWAKVIEAF